MEGLVYGRCGCPESCPYSLCCGKQLCFGGVFALVKRALFFRLANCNCLF